MSKNDQGCPAFPWLETEAHEGHPGMSLLAYYAGRAMQGYLGNHMAMNAIARKADGLSEPAEQVLAGICVQHATAMLAELRRREADDAD